MTEGADVGVARRITQLFGEKVNALLGQAEDPREMLDYSYQRQRELLADVRRGIVEVSASRRRSHQRAGELEHAAEHLRQQAEQAAGAGSDDLARQALAHRARILDRVGELRGQEAALKEDEERLTATARRLQAKTEAFGLRKEVFKADYTAARVAAGADEALTGISEEMGDVGQATRRAEEKTEQARAHADALDDLLASGAPGAEFPATPGHPRPGQPRPGEPAPARPAAPEPAGARLSPGQLQEQLDEIATRAAVDEELARIKQRLARRPPSGGTGRPGPGA